MNKRIAVFLLLMVLVVGCSANGSPPITFGLPPAPGAAQPTALPTKTLRPTFTPPRPTVVPTETPTLEPTPTQAPLPTSGPQVRDGATSTPIRRGTVVPTLVPGVSLPTALALQTRTATPTSVTGATITPVTSSVPRSSDVTATVKAATLWVRSLPDEKSPTSGHVEKSQQLFVIGRSANGWLLIESGSVVGWVYNGSYIHVEGDVATLEDRTPPGPAYAGPKYAEPNPFWKVVGDFLNWLGGK